MSVGESFKFFDKDTYPGRPTTIEDNVRIVPGGSTIRDGAYIAPGVVCMPPMFVNAGAYVDEGTMIDSHALVGSCAQIGKRVHISAAAQIGGVLEPVGAVPVIIEDDVLVGGNCGVYEGTIVRERAVLASGTILTGSTPVYDLVRGEIYQRTGDGPSNTPLGATTPSSSEIAGGLRGVTGPAHVLVVDEELGGVRPLVDPRDGEDRESRRSVAHPVDQLAERPPLLDLGHPPLIQAGQRLGHQSTDADRVRLPDPQVSGQIVRSPPMTQGWSLRPDPVEQVAQLGALGLGKRHERSC